LFSSLEKENKKLIEKINWNNYIYPSGCNSFMQYFLRLEGKEHLATGSWWPHYTSLDYPTKYITTCAHFTKSGQKVMAELIYKFIEDTK
jgi:hypothetical protein